MNRMINTLHMVLIASFYIIVLLLIMVIDLQQRRILNEIALPATLVALAISLAFGRETFFLALLGALIGFLFFYALFWLGGRLYGPGALGFGDVKLAMLLGAMLGLQHILHTLALGILLAGLAAFLLLFAGRAGRRGTLPYGAFLAAAGIFMLLWTNIWLL
jgi:leader peptidase (prepilin peptidase)/N-methyltransferase